MKKGIVSVIFVLLFTANLLNGQVSKRVTLIIPKNQPIETSILTSLNNDLANNQLTDSVSLTGLPYPIIIIEPYQDYLLRNNITSDEIFKALKRELRIPVWPTEEGLFYCKLDDYRSADHGNKIDKIGLIQFKGVDLDTYLPLMQIASIYLKLKSNDVFYHNKKVYCISFNFTGTQDYELQQLLQIVDKYKIDYEVVHDLLSHVQN